MCTDDRTHGQRNGQRIILTCRERAAGALLPHWRTPCSSGVFPRNLRTPALHTVNICLVQARLEYALVKKLQEYSYYGRTPCSPFSEHMCLVKVRGVLLTTGELPARHTKSLCVWFRLGWSLLWWRSLWSTPYCWITPCSPYKEFMSLVQVRMESALVKELKEYSILLENFLLPIQWIYVFGSG